MWALQYLACPNCYESLTPIELAEDGREGLLGHHRGVCEERYPVIEGIPRLMLGSDRYSVYRQKPNWFASSRFADGLRHWADPSGSSKPVGIGSRIVDRFDAEWHEFSSVGTEDQGRLFEGYFDVVPADLLGPGVITLDAGCGAGRWANEVQRRGNRIIAIDLGFSVELAERNTRDTGRVACVQADVRRLPIRDAAVGFA